MRVEEDQRAPVRALCLLHAVAADVSWVAGRRLHLGKADRTALGHTVNMRCVPAPEPSRTAGGTSPRLDSTPRAGVACFPRAHAAQHQTTGLRRRRLVEVPARPALRVRAPARARFGPLPLEL